MSQMEKLGVRKSRNVGEIREPEPQGLRAPCSATQELESAFQVQELLCLLATWVKCRFPGSAPDFLGPRCR